MPLYEYKCGTCSKVFEVRQNFSDDPLTIHEGCGGTVERLISAPALQFKGTGWYVTDYARGGAAKKDKPAANGESSSTSKETSTTSKTDTSSSTSSTSTPTKSDK